MMSDDEQLKEWHKKITANHLDFLQKQQEMFLNFLDIEKKLINHVEEIFDQSHTNIAQPSTNTPPLLDYEQLLVHASGKPSAIFGPKFIEVDNYKKNLRLPLPPYMLLDRVIEMYQDPDNPDEGTITTELDLHQDTWFLHEGRIPFCLMLEACQGHIVLISWLGWDFHHQGSKVYRMLGGSFTLFGDYPQIGDCLRYKIHVRKSQKDQNNLLILDYDCYVNSELKLSVRNANGGFFTAEELHSSKGILWDPEKMNYHSEQTLAPALVQCKRSQFSKQQIEAFAKGDLYSCFGQGYEFGQTHLHSPRIQDKPLLLIDEVQHFDPQGGPWHRGYLRAIQKVSPDDWFFKCHFKDDPVMPGLLSIDAFIQAMSFYLAALGYTLDKDGWRFAVLPKQEYSFIARGQVTTATTRVIYEVFVEELRTEPYPTLIASLLATTSEGVKIYQISHFGLQLIPDTPLTRHPELLLAATSTSVATLNEMKLDYSALLELAMGDPSRGLGAKYKSYKQGKKMPRIPTPPFLFLSRVTEVIGKSGEFKIGQGATLEYDIPPDAWYFSENGQPTMPLCVQIEAILQPPGWLSLYIGSVLQTNEERYVRILNGNATFYQALHPDSGTLRVETKVKNISSAGDITIESFDIKCFFEDKLICEGDTAFGFFSKTSLTQQIGLPTTENDKAILSAPSSIQIDFKDYPLGYSKKGLSLGHHKLKMLDRITGFWKDGGKQKLGLLRAEKEVRPSDWFFRGHFYRDPVQPGSLGLEGMMQLLQFYLMEQRGWEYFTQPDFETPALGTPMSWKYRGQVLTTHNCIIYTMEIESLEIKANSLFATANAALWVGEKKIYEANFGVRLYDKLNDNTY